MAVPVLGEGVAVPCLKYRPLLELWKENPDLDNYGRENPARLLFVPGLETTRIGPEAGIARSFILPWGKTGQG
jgi:hypothetical protein